MLLYALFSPRREGPGLKPALLSVLPGVDGVVTLAPPPLAAALETALEGWRGAVVHGPVPTPDTPEARILQGVEHARRAGATHLLLLGEGHIYPVETLTWCRRLLEEVELRDSALGLPPRQHDRRLDPEVTDGAVIRHLALAGTPASAPDQPSGPPGPRSVRFLTLAGLVAGPDGSLLEPTGEPVTHSPWRLELPGLTYWLCG